MKKLIILTTLMITFAFSTTCFADAGGKLFKVNLIIFTQKNQTAQFAEDWTNQLKSPYLKNTLTLMPYQTDALDTPSISAPTSPTIMGNNLYQYNGLPVYKLLQPQQIGLNRIIRKLDKNNYNVLLNVAWIQPAIQTSRWIHIFGGQAYDAEGNILSSQLNNMQPVPLANFWQVNGMIRISYNNFFNVGLHLYFTQPTQLGSNVQNPSQFGFTPLRTFELFSFRRARAGQMVYFDHPMFGALILITPYKQT